MNKSITQSCFTALIPVPSDRVEPLRTLLGGVVRSTFFASEADTDAIIPGIDFKAAGLVHFARFVLVPDTAGNTWLVFGTDHDGDTDEMLRTLYRTPAIYKGILALLGCCNNVPQAWSEDSFLSYLLQHKLDYGASYIGTRLRTVRRIYTEDALRRRIQALLTQKGATWQHLSALQIVAKIREEILADPPFQNIRDEDTSMPKQRKSLVILLVLALFLCFALPACLVIGARHPDWPLWQTVLAGAGIATGFLALIVGLYLLALRIKEKQDAAAYQKVNPTAEQVGSLIQREDQIIQNQLTHLVDIRPGRFRLLTLRAVLWAINLLAKIVYTDGELGTIPSIHFARWMIYDKGRKLLFFSNFDGSWQNYLGDFVDRASAGLTAVWSNTENFPPTRILINEGATHEHDFKNWTRYYQLQTDFWYSAYPLLSVQNINQNSSIKKELFSDMNEERAKAWLAQF